jgi:hypothetical protein
MNRGFCTISGPLAALVAAGVLLAPTRVAAREQGIEELTRGPVHEAFASTVSFNPEPGLLVATAPPALIEEIPPEQRLEGENVAWIPGYWGWEEDPGDFIWISGIWRNLPPGRQWLPGYWGEVGNQWQWTSGYWADEEVQEIAYLPQPPKSIESGPNIDAPSENHVWISGNWIHRENRYGWTPGYWEPAQANWIWIPAHYQWTHRGYVFINGYWDYNVARRGVLFAPVRFQHSVYSRPGYAYTPSLVISLDVFLGHLFVRPTYGHYYFGDYYSAGYRNRGYHASCSYGTSRLGYEPIFAHNRWEHRDDRGWERGRRDRFDYYRDHQDARPPHTWTALQGRPGAGRKGGRDDFEIAQPLASYAGRPAAGQRFQTVNKAERGKIIEQREQVRQFSQQRRQIESRTDQRPAKTGDKPDPVERQKIARSPVVAKRAEQLSGADAPPRQRGPRDADLPGPTAAKPGADRGKDGKHPARPEMPKKPAADGRATPGKAAFPGREGASRTPPAATRDRTDQPRPERVTEPGKTHQPMADPGRKDDGATPPRGKDAKPEPGKKPEHQAKPDTKPPQGRDKAPQPDPRMEPKPRPKAAPAPTRRPDPQPKPEVKPEKREPKANRPESPRPPPRQHAAPEKKQAAQPERRQPAPPKVAPTPRQAPRQPSQNTPKNKDTEEDPSKGKSRGRRK